MKVLIACIAAFIVSSCLPYPRSQAIYGRPPGDFGFGNVAMSPDGRSVAFTARDGICLYDWRSGELKGIPKPEGEYFETPSFSPEGTLLVAAVRRHRIAIIDLTSLQIRKIFEASEKNEWIYSGPVFQPVTGKILYVAQGAGIWNHFRMLDPVDGTVKTLTEPKSGFYAISTPSFVGNDSVIFAARGPKNLDLKQEVDRYLQHPNTDSFTYRYRLDGQTETTLPEVYRHSLLKGSLTEGITNLAASRNGETIIFIDLSSTEPKNVAGKYNYEIFKLEKNRITQMTNLRSHMTRLAISYDGTTAVFGSDPTRSNAWDLFILDLRTGQVHPTGLLARMVAHPYCVEQ